MGLRHRVEGAGTFGFGIRGEPGPAGQPQVLVEVVDQATDIGVSFKIDQSAARKFHDILGQALDQLGVPKSAGIVVPNGPLPPGARPAALPISRPRPGR